MIVPSEEAAVTFTVAFTALKLSPTAIPLNNGRFIFASSKVTAYLFAVSVAVSCLIVAAELPTIPLIS